MIPQELAKHVTKKDVLNVHLVPNVLNVTHLHISYYLEIVMKSVQVEHMLMMDLVNLVMTFVMNVTEENPTIVTLVNTNTITETHVLNHVLMENGPTQLQRLVITVMTPVKLVQPEEQQIVHLVTQPMTYG